MRNRRLELDERPADELRNELSDYGSRGRPGALDVRVRPAPGRLMIGPSDHGIFCQTPSQADVEAR